MKLCFFGSEPEHKRIMDLLKTIPKYSDYVRQCDAFPDYDSFIAHLRWGDYDAVFVTENNANGMEGVIAARNMRPNIPVVWFSNDDGFGCQAYRLNADFFHCKPVTAHVLEMALDRLPAKLH